MDGAKTMELGKAIQNVAKAEKPSHKIKIGKEFKIATFNVKGIQRKGRRQEIEQYMKKNNIKILAIQETYTRQNSKEARGEYTCISVEKTSKTTPHGQRE